MRFLTIRNSLACGFGISRFENWISCASRRAALLLGYSERVPIRRVRRMPSSHQRKFHVLRLLSKTTLPVLNRAALFIFPSFRQGTRMAEWILARQIPLGLRPSPQYGSAKHDASFQRVHKLSLCPALPRAI